MTWPQASLDNLWEKHTEHHLRPKPVRDHLEKQLHSRNQELQAPTTLKNYN